MSDFDTVQRLIHLIDDLDADIEINSRLDCGVQVVLTVWDELDGGANRKWKSNEKCTFELLRQNVERLQPNALPATEKAEKLKALIKSLCDSGQVDCRVAATAKRMIDELAGAALLTEIPANIAATIANPPRGDQDFPL